MDLVIGNTYNVMVEKFLPFGCVVRMDDNSTGFVHISKISTRFVKDPAEYLSLGSSYVATGIKGSKHPVELSFLPLNLKPTGQENAPPGFIPAKLPPRPAKPKPTINEALTVDDRLYSSNADLDKMIENSRKAYQDKTGVPLDAKKMHKRRRR